MNKWDKRFLELAQVVASWSKDGTKVGSTIVDKRQRVVSLGFNGYPRGVEDNLDVPREERLARILHSEANALLFAQRDVTGLTMYVTRPPCSNCAALIIQAGIARVVFPTPPEDFAERWAASMITSFAMFEEAGVTLTEVK